MFTKEVKDKDGHPYFFVGAGKNDVEQMERKHRAKADAVGCLLREVPSLGSAEPGPFHRSFRVTRGAGEVITKVEFFPKAGVQ